MLDAIDSGAIFTSVMVMLSPMCLEITRNIFDFVKNWLVSLWSKAVKEMSPRVMLRASVNQSPERFHCNNEDRIIINAVCEALEAAGVVSSESTVGSIRSWSKGHKQQVAALVSRPNSSVKYKGMEIAFTEVSNDKGDSSVDMNIYAADYKQIKKFVEDSVQAKFDRDAAEKKQYVLIQVQELHPKFDRYDLKTTTSFDNIFLPEKEHLLHLVNGLRDGRRRKLSLLLYGNPGCGKTSLIRALAAYLGYSVVVVKLSYITCDSDLQRILHDRYINTGHGQVTLTRKRIFVFEDIDAESKAVLNRTPPASHSKSASVSEDDDSMCEDDRTAVISSTKSPSVTAPTESYTITLSGVLNALDGIIELRKSLVILTTNHPEKLDPALTRPGRTDYKIELKKMTKFCANQLVGKYLPGHSLDLNDHEITPASLHELLKDAPDIQWLAEKVSECVGRTVAVEN